MSLASMNVKQKQTVNLSGAAPLENLQILNLLAMQVQDRADHLPGIVTFSGPSGFGKSTAAAFISARYQAIYIEVRSTWTRKSLLEAILHTIGIKPAGTVATMADQVADELASSQRIIILDEFDNAVDRNLVELVRDLYEQSKAPFILIGEELLPQKLQKWERFHGRIMRWAQAQPANIDDAVILNRHYAKDVMIDKDLLKVLVEHARGSVRRIVTNIELISQFAKTEGLQKISLSEWGGRDLHMATPPTPRKKF